TEEELFEFIQKYELPITSTLHGLGTCPGTDELFTGMAGMHGTYAANMALHGCDILINIGARFADRLTGKLDHFAPKAKVAHSDIDPAEIGKNIHTEIPVVSDAKEALKALLNSDIKQPEHKEWMEEVRKNKADYPLWYNRSDEAIS